MEIILRLLGLKPIERHERELKEVHELHAEVQSKLEEMEQEMASMNGEEGWFLARKVPGGRRSGDGDID